MDDWDEDHTQSSLLNQSSENSGNGGSTNAHALSLTEMEQMFADKRKGKPLIVNRYAMANWLEIDSDTVRKIMAKLRRDKEVFFVPAGKKGLYVLYVKGLNDEAVKQYVLNQLAHITSSYFDNVVPFMDIVREHKANKEYEHIINVVGQLELALGENNG